MNKIYYTIEEAEKLLPVVKRKLKDLIRLKKDISDLQSINIQITDESYEGNLLILRSSKDYHKVLYEFYNEMEFLAKKGIIIKNLDLGIIDFYSKFEARDVFLCWKIGEKRINYWHETDSGFIGRKQIVNSF